MSKNVAGDGVLIPGPPEGLCLDFTNTRFWRGTDTPTETLHTPADLLSWFTQPAHSRVVEAVQDRWQAHAAEAEGAFTKAIDLREALYRIFSAVAVAASPAAVEFDTFNAALVSTPARSHLCQSAQGYLWRIPQSPAGLSMLLAPVVWSAADLLTGMRIGRIRQCANPQCRWLFVDDSKSANRRWCSMASCGNRAKAHRHYARSKVSPS